MNYPNPCISKPNPNPNSARTLDDPSSSSPNCPFFIIPGPSASPFKGSHHRRAQSEVVFRTSDDNGDAFDVSLFTDEITSDDDPISMYIDVAMIGDNGGCEGEKNECGNSYGSAIGNRGVVENGSNGKALNIEDCDSVGKVEIVEPKKAMPPNKLAELWISDPKRAKRILANRQSAARSKERKARHILELEMRVETLQKEATTLAAQLSMYQRDTTDLTAENAELRLQLQTMEHQAQLRDDLNEALRREVDRLRLVTGEVEGSPIDSSNLTGPHCSPHCISSPVPSKSQNVQLLPLFHTSTFSPATPSEYLQSNPFEYIHGHDVSNRGYLVKVENNSTSITSCTQGLDSNFSGGGYLV